MAADMITAYGFGIPACWDGIFSKKTAISRLRRFSTKAFQSDYAALINDLEYHGSESLVMQTLKKLFYKAAPKIPEDARLILATSKGEIDLLEKQLLEKRDDFSKCRLDRLLKKAAALIMVKDTGMIISAACASSTTALAQAASIIRAKRSDCVIVVACDSVTEFVFSGFSSLMALDKTYARPFDNKRSGLSLGEAAAFALIMSESRAKREKRKIMGKIAGWGLSNDANHVTAPSRSGSGLAAAINKALQTADIDYNEIGSISAHGTGTVYNDAMEMKAFSTVFGDNKCPVYSIKGAIGHTLVTAGLIEAIIALRSLKEGVIPPTVNLEEVDEDARGRVFAASCSIPKNKMALSTNSGFGGINAALILSEP